MKCLLKSAIPCVLAFGGLASAAAEDKPAVSAEPLSADAALVRIAAGREIADSVTGEPVALRPEIRAGALLRLGRSAHPEALATLTEALSDADPEVRLAAARGLRDLSDPASAPALAVALGAARPRERSVTVSFTDVDTADENFPLVARAREIPWPADDNLAVRQEAARALGELGVPSGAGALIEAMGTGPAELSDVSESALEILANRSFRSGRAEVADAAARIATWREWWGTNRTRDRSTWVLDGFREVAQDLPDLESDAAVRTFVRLLTAPQSWIRANAADRLTRIASSRDEAKLASLLDVFREIAAGRDLPAGPSLEKDPLSSFARRQFARTFARAAWRMSDLRKLPPEGRPAVPLVPGLAPQAPHAGIEKPVETVGELAAWWAAARTAAAE